MLLSPIFPSLVLKSIFLTDSFYLEFPQSPKITPNSDCFSIVVLNRHCPWPLLFRLPENIRAGRALGEVSIFCLELKATSSSPVICRRNPISKPTTKLFSISQQGKRAWQFGERAQRAKGGRQREQGPQVLGPEDSRNQGCEK